MAGTMTIRDVARAAGVAVGTVSRVLNGHRSVSPDVRQKVVETIRQLGYEPDAIAQSMRLRATRTVACAIRDISIHEFGTFVKAAEEVLREFGYTLLLTNTDEREDREIDLLRTFVQRRVDGIIMTMSAEDDAALCRAIEQTRIPVVLMDRDAPIEVDAVTIDHRRGTRAATEYLFNLGHRRIALLTGRPAMRPARERIAGFEEAYKGAGLKVDPTLIRCGAFSADFAFREISTFLSSSHAPTALIAGGMSMIPGVLRAVELHGLKIPDDISVIAGADSDLAALVTPRVTAVRWSNADWGRLAVRLLLDRIEATYAGGPRRVMLPTELIMRASCAPPGRERKRSLVP